MAPQNISREQNCHHAHEDRAMTTCYVLHDPAQAPYLELWTNLSDVSPWIIGAVLVKQRIRHPFIMGGLDALILIGMMRFAHQGMTGRRRHTIKEEMLLSVHRNGGSLRFTIRNRADRSLLASLVPSAYDVRTIGTSLYLSMGWDRDFCKEWSGGTTASIFHHLSTVSP